MTGAKLSATRTVRVADIEPYWRNPRRISQEAVDAVAESIKRYGYQQPIVVDRSNVIVVGHTRYQAILQLGWDEVEVYVTDLPEEKAREYRIIDNRTSEYSMWDHKSLVLELREFENELLEQFFPFIDLEMEQVAGASGPSQSEIDWAKKQAESVPEASESKMHTTSVVCPACFHTFEVRTKSLPGMTDDDVKGLMNGAAG